MFVQLIVCLVTALQHVYNVLVHIIQLIKHVANAPKIAQLVIRKAVICVYLVMDLIVKIIVYHVQKIVWVVIQRMNQARAQYVIQVL